jgi:iron complex outermembrane receptor protein
VTPGYAPAVTNARYGIVAGPKNLQVAANGPSEGKSTAQGGTLQVDYDLGRPDPDLDQRLSLGQAPGLL